MARLLDEACLGFCGWRQRATPVDYDGNTYDRELAEILANPDLGANSEERQAMLQRARRLSNGLNIAALVLMFLPALLPVFWRPFCVWAILLLPWIALVALHHYPVIRIFAGSRRRRSAYPQLLVLFFVSPLGLVFANSQLGHLISLKPALTAAILPGVVVALAFVGLVPSIRLNRWLWLFLLVFGVVYSGGALVYADMAQDRSPAEHHWAMVVGKHVSTGKSTTYYFELEPWLGHVVRAQVAVPRWLYNSEDLGSSVDVVSHSGAIGMPWYTVQSGAAGAAHERHQRLGFNLKLTGSQTANATWIRLRCATPDKDRVCL